MVGSYAAQKVGCGAQSGQDRLNCLQSVEVLDLISLENDGFASPAAAVIDGVVLVESPAETVARGEVNVRELIIGRW